MLFFFLSKAHNPQMEAREKRKNLFFCMHKKL
jgi:hypothetical protein